MTYRLFWVTAVMSFVVVFAASAPLAQTGGGSECRVEPTTTRLGVDPFYKKYCTASGLLVLSSANVPDAALRAAADIVTHMLAPMPDVQRRLQTMNLKIAVIGASEVTTDIPEHKILKARFPDRDFDKRTRGMGANGGRDSVTSGAEENLLCYPNDRYRGENIFVHEFSHSIKSMGLEPTILSFRRELQEAYSHAKATGLWANTYAQVNVEEYWAEGVQSYFDTNLFSDPPNGIHNSVNTRDKLKGYDPQLFAIIDRAFAGSSWRPRCP